MRSFIFAVAGASVVLAAASAEAGNPRRFHGNAPNQQNSVPSKQAIIGAYGRAVYPKYYYGFHSRDFQNIGMPHGDIGVLGNGMTRSPW